MLPIIDNSVPLELYVDLGLPETPTMLDRASSRREDFGTPTSELVGVLPDLNDNPALKRKWKERFREYGIS